MTDPATRYLAWLEERECTSVVEARGSVSRSVVAHPDAYERADHVNALRKATDRTLG